MTKRILCLSLVVTALGGCIMVGAGKNSVSADIEATEEAPVQVLRHLVLFRFKEDATVEQIKAVETAFCALPSKIDTIYDYEWGTDVSTENLADGFTHSFLVTFKSEADRAVYLPHPEHKAFVEVLKPALDKVIVLDYWAEG
jgi:Stress responsive A/B Barrel Domain